jgi:hypothetical protein
MTEQEQTALHRILAFAAHVAQGGQTDAADVARSRNWIDAEDRPTPEGLDLFAALSDQAQTRTVFRGNF